MKASPRHPPLHELKTMNRTDAQPDPALKQTAGVPKFAADYDAPSPR